MLGARCMQSNVFGRTLYNHAITNHRAAYNTRMIFFYGVMIAYICNNRLAKLKQPEIYPAKIYTIDIAYMHIVIIWWKRLHSIHSAVPMWNARRAHGQSACFGCSVFLVSLSQLCALFNVFSLGHKSFVSHSHISQIPSRVRFNFLSTCSTVSSKKKN